MLFPQFHIDEVKRQTMRDLNRFDPSYRYTVPARREHATALRITKGAAHGGGLHRVRTARGLLRRRPGHGGEAGRLFFGKAQSCTCHDGPIYSDNFMHNLQTERFFSTKTVRNHTMVGDGPIKSFPLRGIKESPPYLHDGRLLTL